MKTAYKCPKCGKELKGDDFEMVSAYHNTNDIICKLCGHEGHWMDFLIEHQEKMKKANIKNSAKQEHVSKDLEEEIQDYIKEFRQYEYK